MSAASPIRIAILLVLAAVPLAPAASAQDPGAYIYRYQLELLQDARVDIPVNGQVFIGLRFTDLSRDGYATYLPPGTPPPPGVSPIAHQVSWEITPETVDPGWSYFTPSSFISTPGQVTDVDFPLQVTAQSKLSIYPFNVTAVVQSSTGNVSRTSVSIVGFSLGPQSFGAQIGKSYQLRPKQIEEIEVKLVNLANDPRAFDMKVVDNPCGMLAGTANNNLVPGKGSEIYTVSIQTPGKKIWYFSELCTLAIQINPTDDPGSIQTAYVSVQVNGGYLNPVWVFNTVGLLLLLLLLLFLLARRKARIEEEILGKPQKPWLIPVEALYLKALRRKDARAWYVVRHYLMEDEYRSSLLWYKSYKKQTKGSRKKESLVLRQEKAYEGWKRAWAKDIAKPIRKADRFDAKLQRKLDRKAEKAHRKQLGKYGSVRGQMEKAHAKKVERLSAAHEKVAAKARKKGQPVPPKPVVAKPDYPEEPGLVPLVLAEHKWAKKSARFRARMVRRQGDLEVKFEKADARRLRKVRRKVQRLARKLDDPEFVAEHPLLQGS